MEITIPGVLANGSGPAIAAVGEQTGRAGRSIGEYLDKIQKNYDYNDATDITNGLELQLQDHATQFTQKDGGNDPEAIKKYQEEQKKIIDGAVQVGGKINERVQNYVKTHAGTRAVDYTTRVNSALAANMYKRSIKTDTDNAQLVMDQAVDQGGDVYTNLKAALNETFTKVSARETLYGGNTKDVYEAVVNKGLLNTLDNALRDPSKASGIITMMRDPKAKDEILGLLTPEGKTHVQGLLKATEKDATAQVAFGMVYNDPSFQVDGKFNPQLAIQGMFTPDGMKKFGLTPESAGVVGGLIQHHYNAEMLAEKARLEKNMEVIYAKVPTDPLGAKRMIRQMIGTGEIDAKEGNSLYNSIESGERADLSLSLQQQQAKVTLGVYDLRIAILSGKFKSPNEVAEAVGKLGPAGYKELPGMLTAWKESQKDTGKINYFAEADKYLDTMLSGTKGKAAKADKLQQHAEIKTSLLEWMKKNNISIDDPAVKVRFDELYKAANANWVSGIKDSLFGDDTPKADDVLKSRQPQKKFIGYKKGTRIPVYDLGNGNWKEGD